MDLGGSSHFTSCCCLRFNLKHSSRMWATFLQYCSVFCSCHHLHPFSSDCLACYQIAGWSPLSLLQLVGRHPVPNHITPSLDLCVWWFAHRCHLPNMLGWWTFIAIAASWHRLDCRSFPALYHGTPVLQSGGVPPKQLAMIVQMCWTWGCAMCVWLLRLTVASHTFAWICPIFLPT